MLARSQDFSPVLAFGTVDASVPIQTVSYG